MDTGWEVEREGKGSDTVGDSGVGPRGGGSIFDLCSVAVELEEDDEDGGCVLSELL